ncbi:ATP-dependent (S)-NAD(P)H-hydrate dehydratase isoform X2 [Planococcus citri]|uniref:ATP-dependent (S)-NAD(P)H-hydrate dehydratase isoform X2 n=1 Tax=Planococcus citri TaxID=170843 RepID=UPI0031F94507
MLKTIYRNRANLTTAITEISPILTPKFVKKMSSVPEQELQAAAKTLPPALSESKHKGQAGRIGIIGGSSEYTGAPYFAGITALRCGADLTYIFCMKDAAIPIKSYSPELIVLPFLDAEHGKSLTTTRLLNIHSLVIGPGLGENVDVHQLVVSIIQYVKENQKILFRISLVFDADGIGLLADNKDVLLNYPGSIYITPNANEIKKLAFAYFGRRDINTSDDATLQELVNQIHPNAVLILKGQNDKIVTPDGTYVCSTPGSLRRCGGQGDILSGSLGLFSYWANLYKEKEDQSNIPAEVIASYSACSITRLCSQFAHEEKERAMVTSDMLSQIGKAYKTFFSS